jgi:phosphoenolpyruvate carboxykinase (ATP)
MFRRIFDAEEIEAHEPAFTVVQAPHFHAVSESDGTNSEAFIILNFGERLAIIGGTSYAGEIKKAIFTVLNYLLPDEKVLSMHCAANIGKRGDVALFFGLSGTGKTTLSADPDRMLIGDDEHGWCEEGIFNFEGGCYAKVIRLSPEAEPDIYECTRRFGTVLENVAMDRITRRIDLDDDTLTENTRAAYPVSHIANHVPEGYAGHPENILMLTCDAFGVLPPVAKLTYEQAMYHFLSGYTAKVAGAERGVTEPQETFSPCFGSPFMARQPSVYARMLGENVQKHDVHCWLVNTGWTGGPYGTGKRMDIGTTRAIVAAILDGSLANRPLRVDPIFGMEIPTECPHVPPSVLDPKSTWADAGEYEARAKHLVELFRKNFGQFTDDIAVEIAKHGL